MSSSPGRRPGSAGPIRPRCASRRCGPPRRRWRSSSASRPVVIAIGGRSFGGRMCSLAVAEGLSVAALVLISYPLHPPGRPDRLRTEHFPALDLPCLFVSGRRDAFATPEELERETAAIPGPVTRHVRRRRSLAAQERGRGRRDHRRLDCRAVRRKVVGRNESLPTASWLVRPPGPCGRSARRSPSARPLRRWCRAGRPGSAPGSVPPRPSAVGDVRGQRAVGAVDVRMGPRVHNRRQLDCRQDLRLHAADRPDQVLPRARRW